MSLTSPKFWNQSESYLGYFLTPLSWLYQAGTIIHQKFSKPYKAEVPVISIGNFVLGGAGKTPLTLAIAKALQTMGYTPHIVSRGYGGSLHGPLQVDPHIHQFHQVGDEPLLLAKTAPTWVSKHRRAAIKLAVEAGADILLLDDGHQNHTIKKDISFMVVNAAQGFGNERVFPAGPLRQTIQYGLKNTSALVYISDESYPLPKQLSSIQCPLIRAKIEPRDSTPETVIGFAGIGYPDKFLQTLVNSGYDVKAFSAFPDHYPYTEKDLHQLQMQARAKGASLITTEKDVLRIPEICRADILTLPIELKFYPEIGLENLLKQLLQDLLQPTLKV